MDSCGDECSSGSKAGFRVDLPGVKNKIMVLSGKGGVGKSSIAVALSLGLAERGFKVGLTDVDLHGPSVPVILGKQEERVLAEDNRLLPVEVTERLKAISIGFLLHGEDDAVIWRGPLKMTAIRQFMEDVKWGDLDFLVIDSPPGTGDEPLSIAQMIPDAWALIVTTPQEMALADVRKSVNFCRSLGLRILGLVENMSGMVCPHCGHEIEVFSPGGGKRLSEDMKVELLTSLPIDRAFSVWADRGGAGAGHYRDLANVAPLLDEMVDKVIRNVAGFPGKEEPAVRVSSRQDGVQGDGAGQGMGRSGEKFAVPVEGELLCSHFGHCERFALIELGDDGEPELVEACSPPPHEPGLLPNWLSDKGVNTVIAGDMGQRAVRIFAEKGIEVICGAPQVPPLEAVRKYLSGDLEMGENVCDH